MNLPVVIAALPVGAVVGSFAATAGLRWARGEQALTGRSHCDACNAPLGLGRTVPILSYALQGGNCLDCRAPIHPGHLFGEVLGAALAMISVTVLPIGQALLATGLGLVLIGAGAADAASRRLPDVASLAVTVLGGVLAWQRGPLALLTGLIAAVITGALLLAVRRVFAAGTGDPKMGLGDVKLAMALAIWAGAATPWVFVIAGPLGLVQTRLVKSADRSIAFGPALALGGWAVGLALQAGLFGDLIP
jgi:leader peptidase (prepilin peptidase)/N-methyltransferase